MSRTLYTKSLFPASCSAVVAQRRKINNDTSLKHCRVRNYWIKGLSRLKTWNLTNIYLKKIFLPLQFRRLYSRDWQLCFSFELWWTKNFLIYSNLIIVSEGILNLALAKHFFFLVEQRKEKLRRSFVEKKIYILVPKAKISEDINSGITHSTFR